MNPGHWFSVWLLSWCVVAGSSSRKHSQQHSQLSQHRKHKDYQQHHKPVHNEYNTEYYDEESMNIRRKLFKNNFLLKASAFIVCRLIHLQLFLQYFFFSIFSLCSGLWLSQQCSTGAASSRQVSVPNVPWLSAITTQKQAAHHCSGRVSAC